MPHRLSLLLTAGVLAVSGPMLAGQLGQPAPTPAPTSAGAAPTALLAGQVVEQGTGRGIAGATVILLRTAGSSVQAPATGRGVAESGIARDQGFGSIVSTDSQGRFVFAPLAAGTYAFQVTKVGYTSDGLSFVRGIDVGAGERVTDVKVRISKFATIAGTIRDEGGDPVVGTEVWAFRRSVINGRRALARPVTARSDDRGGYRISGLSPGEYVVCACRRDPIPFDGVLLTSLAADPLNLMGVAARALRLGADAATIDSTLRTYAPTFHPNSGTVARASRVVVASGEEKLAVDVDVTAVRATRLSGNIVGAVGAVQASSLRLVPAGESEEGAALAVWLPALVQPTGRFDFAGVPPGQYVLRVAHMPTDPAVGGAPSGAALQFIGARASALGQPTGRGLANEPPQWAMETIFVGDQGASGLSVVLRQVPILSGRVEFAGTAARPSGRQPIVIMLPVVPDVFAPGPGGPNVMVAADGTFRIPGVLPGRYAVGSSGVPGYANLSSVVVAGVDVTDLPLAVDAADIADVVITLTDTPMGTLTGTATGPGGSPADGTSVLMFPVDRKYWAEPGAGRRRFRALPVSRKGAFTIAAIPAGEYLIVAVADEDVVDWQEPSRLEVLSRSAQRVQVRDGDKTTLEVRR